MNYVLRQKVLFFPKAEALKHLLKDYKRCHLPFCLGVFNFQWFPPDLIARLQYDIKQKSILWPHTHTHTHARTYTNMHMLTHANTHTFWSCILCLESGACISNWCYIKNIFMLLNTLQKISFQWLFHILPCEHTMIHLPLSMLLKI